MNENDYYFKKTYNFKVSNSLGKVGERHIKDWLLEGGFAKYVAGVTDVSDNPEYQKQDIDFIIQWKPDDGPPFEITAEVKTDRYINGNIYFETISNATKKTPGCMYITQADLLFYYFINCNRVYVLDRRKYIKWFDDNYLKYPGTFRKKVVYNTHFNSIGYAFKKDYLDKEAGLILIAKVFDDED